MQLSKVMSQLKPSPTIALNTKAKAMKADGHDVQNLTIGEPDFAPPKEAVDACVAALKSGDTRYSTPGGSVPLRNAISKKLSKDNDLTFESDEIVAGIGAKEILFHVFSAILDPGNEVLIPAPYWVSYPDQIMALNAKPIAVPPQTGPNYRYELPVSSLEKLASEHTRAIVLNSPNNPCGYVFSKEQLEELGAFLRQKSWWIILDEIYEYLTFDCDHLSLLQVCPDLKDRVILVNGLSKGFAMTGFRVGYCAAPKRVAKIVKTLQSQSSTCLPPFIEKAAITALEAGKECMSEKITGLRQKRDSLISALHGVAGVWHFEAQGSFYLMINIQNAIKNSSVLSKKSSMAFCEYLLDEKHLAVIPGEAFGAPGFVRISYACDDAVLQKATKKFCDALNEVKG